MVARYSQSVIGSILCILSAPAGSLDSLNASSARSHADTAA